LKNQDSINQLKVETDLRKVDYDLHKHDWPKYWLSIAKEFYPQIETLENVHEHLQPKEILKLARYCQSVCSSTEFCDRIDAYYTDIVESHMNFEEWMIQRYFTIRIVIPDQSKKGRLLPFHQGVFVGNGLGLRTIWTPFTDAFDSNSMHIISHKHSCNICRENFNNKFENDRFRQECLKYSNPINVSPGQAFLFQQTHLHGNVNNTTSVTRWSMDGRILPKGGHYHRKLPGGYFRFIGEREPILSVKENANLISYVGWNTAFTHQIPLPMQRTLINNYCTKNELEINDYLFENEYCDWLPSLMEFITGYNVDGIILCSIYALPNHHY